jgi:hypothetical protein
VATQRVGGGRESGACRRDIVDEQHAGRYTGAAGVEARTDMTGGRGLTGLRRTRMSTKRGTGAEVERAGNGTREELGVVEATGMAA